jgi:hypothetical protein
VHAVGVPPVPLEVELEVDVELELEDDVEPPIPELDDVLVEASTNWRSFRPKIALQPCVPAARAPIPEAMAKKAS